MCASCGCDTPDVDHGDSRSITLLDLRRAAEAAGIPVAEAATNISKTVAQCCKATRTDMAGVVIKADDSQRFLLTVAYPAYKTDAAVAADGHIDVASDQVVERACWNFMRKGAKLGMWHKDGNSDCGEVVENYVWRGEPWVLKAADGTDQTIMPGDWLVGMILTEPTWALYKARLIGGVSPQGGARRRLPSAETLERMRSRLS